MPGFDVTAWFALYAPTGTPQAVIDKLNAEVNKALASEEIKHAYEGAGFQLPPSPNSPDQLGKFTESEVNKWAVVIKKTGLKEN